MHSTVSSAPQQTRRPGPLFNWLAVITLIYLILVAVGAVSHGFKGFSGGAEGAAQIFAFANNPFVALLLGILATALVQSSSTVTSVIVGLVAGGLPMAMAIPMVMGANLGTTITNTIVSLGHIRDREEFRRAFAAATVHDFFNLLAVFIFLPLELMFGLLQHSAEWLANLEASYTMEEQRSQHHGTVGRNLQAGPDLADRVGLFQHRDLRPAHRQGAGSDRQRGRRISRARLYRCL